jgi:glutamyl endopeptidase
MTAKKYQPTKSEPRGTSMIQEEKEGGGGDTGDLHVVGALAPSPTESEQVVEEVAGNVSVTQESAEIEGAHEEVGVEGAESAEEYAEATPEQLAATPRAEESAASDLRPIKGFEELAGEEAAEEAEPSAVLPEAGFAVDGKQELFTAILGPLASTVIPVLASKVGPAIARGIREKLSSKAKAILRVRKTGTGPLAVIARLLETAEQQPAESFGTESGMEANETLVNEAAQMLEAIVDTDDRVRITTTQRVPWRRICALRIYMSSGAVFRGTGFLIGQRAVATAGHCVYMHNQGGWARRIEVFPGCNGTQHPFSEAVSTTFRSVNGWIQDKKPESDYGCIVLPAGAFGGQTLGSFGFGVFPNSVLLAQDVVIAGFPGDKLFAELWGAARKLKAATALQVVYNTATMGGESGAPAFIKKGGKRYVIGIHNYGAATGNSATRITAAVFQNLQQWSKTGAAAEAPRRPAEAVVAPVAAAA